MRLLYLFGNFFCGLRSSVGQAVIQSSRQHRHFHWIYAKTEATEEWIRPQVSNIPGPSTSHAWRANSASCTGMLLPSSPARLRALPHTAGNQGQESTALGAQKGGGTPSQEAPIVRGWGSWWSCGCPHALHAVGPDGL